MTTSTRECGTCEACCFVAEVKEGVVNKPACHTCPFADHGCTIYGKPERPAVCNTFRCSWLGGFGTQTDRPDQSGVMVSINKMNGGTWINVMELKPNAFRTTGKRIIADIASKIKLPVIVVAHEHLEKGKGDYVIIQKSLEPRSNQIRGKRVGTFTKDMTIYHLIIS